MKIQYRRYLISPCENSIGNFDLKEVIVRTKKKDPDDPVDKPAETYKAEKELKFGISLESCLNTIIKAETALNFGQSVIEITDYLNEYKKQTEELKAYIENKTQIKIK